MYSHPPIYRASRGKGKVHGKWGCTVYGGRPILTIKSHVSPSICTYYVFCIIHHVGWLLVLNKCVLLHAYLVNNTVTKLISAQ